MISKRYCVNGHDTFLVGRKKNYTCKECERERKRNLTKEQREKVNESAKKYWNNRSKERREKDRILRRKYDDKRLNDPIRRMKINTKRRIMLNERKLNQ